MKKFIIIEDDNNIRFILSTILSTKDRQVETYTNCSQIDIYSLENVDLIICDINTPILNGIEFFYILQSYKFCKNIPFVFISGNSNAYDCVVNFKNSYLLKKPISYDLLLIVVETLTSEDILRNEK